MQDSKTALATTPEMHQQLGWRREVQQMRFQRHRLGDIRGLQTGTKESGLSALYWSLTMVLCLCRCICSKISKTNITHTHHLCKDNRWAATTRRATRASAVRGSSPPAQRRKPHAWEGRRGRRPSVTRTSRLEPRGVSNLE